MYCKNNSSPSPAFSFLTPMTKVENIVGIIDFVMEHRVFHKGDKF